MYGTLDVSRPSAGETNGGSQPIAQLAAALVELAEAQRATDQKLAQLVTISQAEAAAQQGRAEHAAAMETRVRPVTVNDISMSFGAMVAFMVKWAIAAIPAAIILVLLWAFAMFFGTVMLAVMTR